jgi:hypothetical protein
MLGDSQCFDCPILHTFAKSKSGKRRRGDRCIRAGDQAQLLLTLQESNQGCGRSPTSAVDQPRSSYCEELAF